MTEHTERRGGHLEVYVAWPVLGGLALAAVLALSVGGAVAVVKRDFAGVGTVAGVVFFTVLGGSTLLLFLYAAGGWGGPARIERMRQPVEVVEVVEPKEDPWRVIRPRTSRLPATVDHEVKGIEPDVDPDIKRLYTFITRVWPGGNVSRSACRDLGFSRRTWERMVGGVRGKEGSESGRGILDRAGCVERTSGGWELAVDLGQALGFNDELRDYADRRSSLVRLGRDGTGRDGTDPVSGPSVPSGRGRG